MLISTLLHGRNTGSTLHGNHTALEGMVQYRNIIAPPLQISWWPHCIITRHVQPYNLTNLTESVQTNQ